MLSASSMDADDDEGGWNGTSSSYRYYANQSSAAYNWSASEYGMRSSSHLDKEIFAQNPNLFVNIMGYHQQSCLGGALPCWRRRALPSARLRQAGAARWRSRSLQKARGRAATNLLQERMHHARRQETQRQVPMHKAFDKEASIGWHQRAFSGCSPSPPS